MVIKVFISLPREKKAGENLQYFSDLRSRLDNTIKGVDFEFKGRFPTPTENNVKCYADNVLIISNCDVVVLADGSGYDERCRWEEHLANDLHIPVCLENEFSRVVRGRISKLITGEGATCHNIFSGLKNKAGFALARLTDLQRSQSDISQATFVTEECSELIKELTKAQRGNGCEKDIIAEACDVLTSVGVLLRLMNVSEEHIYDQIVYKCNRAVQRFEETGKF